MSKANNDLALRSLNKLARYSEMLSTQSFYWLHISSPPDDKENFPIMNHGSIIFPEFP